MRQPPRPAEAPLFGTSTWRQALSQGSVVMLAALVLAFWPACDLEVRRSLVFSLLLLAGGGLVWLNSGAATWLTAAGAGIGIGLWLILLVSPSLQTVLRLAPLQPIQMLAVLVTTGVAMLLAAQLNRRPGRPARFQGLTPPN